MQVAVHRCFPDFDLIGQSPGLGFEFTTSDDNAAFADLAAGSDAMVINGPGYTRDIATRVMQSGSRLKFIQFVSAGYENAEFFGVPDGVRLSNGSIVWAPIVAEHAVALLLGVLRRMPKLERMRATSSWDRSAVMPGLGSLEDSRVGILGYGTIGQEIAKRLSGFGAEVIGFARNEKPCEHADLVASMTELPKILPTLKALINVVPAGPRTLKLVDAAFLGLMRPDAVFVNVGRGATVDEDALFAALSEGRLAGAGLDVFETEPMAAGHKFWSLENAILSPHVAGFGSPAAMRRAHKLCQDNLANFRDGKPLRSEIFL